MAKGKITFKARDYKVGKPHVSKRELQRNNIIEIKSKRVCLRCNESIPVRYNLASKFCSPKCKHAYHYDKRMGRILDEVKPEVTIEVVNITERVETCSVYQNPDTITPQRIELPLETRPKTVYINNDFERYIEMRKTKTIWEGR